MRSTIFLIILAIAVPTYADTAALYKTKCAMCHGATGNGDTAVGKKMGIKPFASDAVQKQTDAQLIDIITKGKGKMTAFGGKLSADEIKALASHIRTFAKK
ncbi:MAG TPA: cytochrome c [Thermoanaerobaculia bacterium]|nr:cytochrome c [Thermoanaerobaculia bacterium]